MQVPASIQSRVIAKLQDGIARAEAKYGQKFAMPQVSYDLRGCTGGNANYVKWTIRLNAVLLMENVETFFARTVPHELAHLINDRVFPESHKSVGVTTMIRKGKLIIKRAPRDVHGETWQSVCLVLGMSDVTRCHQYDVTNSKVIKSTSRTIKWKCSRCNTEMTLSPKMSAQLDMAPTSRFHRPCRGFKLVRVIAAPTVDLRVYGAVAHASLPSPVVKLPPAPGVMTSKIDMCKVIYSRAPAGASRADIITKFVSDAGCTVAGAGTYYATCKKLYG